MNKELTPLQALEYLDDIAHGRFMEYDPHELKIIVEKSLKEYIGLQFAFKISNRNESKIIYNKFKAFEILKKYITIEETDDDLFPYHIEEYQYVSSKSCKVITKEEYELLKEVLENDK